MPPRPLETGDPRTLGRFDLLARLGEGGQGIVYLGRGTGPGEERVAVKVLRSSVDASVLQRLARELDDLCVAGTMTFALRDGNLAYLWTNGVEQNIATLRKR